jgi:hypothetical protein
LSRSFQHLVCFRRQADFQQTGGGLRQLAAQADCTRPGQAMVQRPKRLKLESKVRIDPAALPELTRSITLRLMGGDGDARRRDRR